MVMEILFVLLLSMVRYSSSILNLPPHYASTYVQDHVVGSMPVIILIFYLRTCRVQFYFNECCPIRKPSYCRTSLRTGRDGMILIYERSVTGHTFLFAILNETPTYYISWPFRMKQNVGQRSKPPQTRTGGRTTRVWLQHFAASRFY